MDRPPTAPSGQDLWFPSTSWGALRPADATPDAGAAALDFLARRYWRPIHAWLRRALSRGDEEARELAQDFFLWMIETGFVMKADPARGRFRAFLKAALRHYVADQDRRQRALKRGGGHRFADLGLGDDAAPFEPEDAAARTPDEILDEAWRAETVQQALARTDRALASEGKEVVFAVFRDYFLDPAGADYKAVAARHGITTTDVSNFLMRAKERYRAALRAVVVETVQSPDDLEAELAWLLKHAGP